MLILLIVFFYFNPYENAKYVSDELYDTIKIVSDYSSFKSALEDSVTTLIYLDTDIIMTVLGITINSAKTELIIDGTSPVSGITHSITDYDSLAQYDAITLRTNSSLKSITMRNITLYGKNYYGTVSVYAAVTNAVIKYDNIKYYGPQLTYNINGIAHYKDSYIEIGKFGGLSPAEQLCETPNVIFEGNTTVTQVEAQAYEIIHSLYAGSVEIAQNANIIINTYLESGFFNGAAATNFIIHENAKFHYYGKRRFWDGVSFRNVTVNPHASLYIELEGMTSTSLLWVIDALNVEYEAELVLINKGSIVYPIIYMNAEGARFKNPKRVVLYSSGYRPLYYGIAGLLSIDAQQVRYWSAATPLDTAGGFFDIPKYHWNKLDDSNIEITGTIVAGVLGNFNSFSSNYNSQNTTGTDEINSTTFNQSNARVLSFGRLPITAEYVHLSETASEIIGTSEPGANIIITYFYEEETTLNTVADSEGNYIIPLNYTINDGTVITAKSNKMFLTSEMTFIASNNEFKMGISTSNIEFETTHLSYKTKIVKRNNPDWDIVITDNRGEGSTWSLSIIITTPLSYTDSYNSYTLDNSLIFIDNSGNIHTLSTDYETPVLTHTTANDIDITTIIWADDRGLLARIEPDTAVTDIPYRGSIMWILKDVP